MNIQEVWWLNRRFFGMEKNNSPKTRGDLLLLYFLLHCEIIIQLICLTWLRMLSVTFVLRKKTFLVFIKWRKVKWKPFRLRFWVSEETKWNFCHCGSSVCEFKSTIDNTITFWDFCASLHIGLSNILLIWNPDQT